MKTTFAIVLVLFVVGLVAGIVVPPEPRETSLVAAAEQPSTDEPPNRIAYNRARGATVPIANDSAPSSAPATPLLAKPGSGAAVPLTDLLGIAGLLGGGAVTVLLLRGGRPGDGRSHARSEVPRHQP